ncbi:hypothetical protein FACS1894170_13140 [Planctomycetales bacterium]|nr:hypothetical protein FACS1894170_13140 [Planctomycetales bacterium]
MDIHGKITGIRYTPLLTEPLRQVNFNDFDVNAVPTACIVKEGNYSAAVSRWVSPKRTRSYPFERVYNTLKHSKKITVIPVVKDEGGHGDRDYIQWDTVSLMSLLDVFVIFAYYDKAEINVRNPKKIKITNQQYNNEFVKAKIKEIEQYHSSALHWNLNELKINFHSIVDLAAKAYRKIEKQTGVALHNSDGLVNFKTKIGQDVSNFMAFSRDKSKQAQAREMVTVQPKESLQTLTKATITIENYLGGQYFLTADEIDVAGNIVHLIESKHSKNAVLPSMGDVKDGILKMILFSNLTDVTVDSKPMKSKAFLRLTSSKLDADIASKSKEKDVLNFFAAQDFSDYPFSEKERDTVLDVFDEANKNKFTVQIQYAP